MVLVRCSILIALAMSAAGAQELFPVRDSGEARSRSYDVLHYRIQISLDETSRSVQGTVTTTLVPFLPELRSVDFDAEKMTIRDVTDGSGRKLAFEVLPATLRITLDRAYSYRDTLRLRVSYACSPRKGLYFVSPDSSAPSAPWQIWSQGEDMDNHFWFPCYDYPNDVATSELIATVHKKFRVLSNGRLVGVTEDKASGTKTFHWYQSKPHVSYLIMIAAGEYTVLKDVAGTVPLEYWVYPHHVEDARVCFEPTPDIMRFFTERIGVPYPWEKYAQVLCHEFVAGGMENTSATSLADKGAVFDRRSRIDRSAMSLIAHELAHQWWGDAVTCRDWRHLWLNESFASYFDQLYAEHELGRDEFEYQVYEAQQAGIASDRSSGRKPIVSVGSYGANLYPRGASVLHMLRSLLGDSLFWRSMRHYISKHQFTPVETNDLKRAIEDVTGQNLHWFFDQWVYKAGYPVFDVSYSWEEASAMVRLRVAQVQTADSLTGTFRAPVDVEIWTATARTTHRLEILSRDTTFSLRSADAPVAVLFDPRNVLLKEVRFHKTLREWMLQAERAASPVLRIQALKEIAAQDTGGLSLPAVTALAGNDPFWGVRLEAVTSLRTMARRPASDNAAVCQALCAAAHDRKPAVRAAAVSALSNEQGSLVLSTLRDALQDSSYTVEAAAVSALAAVDSAHALELVVAYLDVPSYGEVVAGSALRALTRLDSTRAVTESIRLAAQGERSELRWSAFWILARYGQGRADVTRTLLSAMRDRNRWVRWTAIEALGNLGGQTELDALDALARDTDDPYAERARASAEKIRTRLGQQEDGAREQEGAPGGAEGTPW